MLGKYVNHKGRSRHFTSPEELEQERKKEEAKKWRKKQQGKDDEDEESGSEEEEGSGENEESGSEEEESEDDDAPKGVHSLIEIENPNRVQKKSNQKVTVLDGPSSSAAPPVVPELSRREREELERQKRQANYEKAHAEGKTEQARADLARLAIIKQRREEAAKMREDSNKKKGPK